VLGVDEWVQGNGSRAFLPLTRHCASKRKWMGCFTLLQYPAESCDYACFAPLRHYRNSLSRFSFFVTALFSWVTNKNLRQEHCSPICNALMMMITGVIETIAMCHWYRFHWPWFSS